MNDGHIQETSFDDLIFHVRRSRIYHEMRLGFLEGIQRFKVLIELVLGSAAAVSLISAFSPLILPFVGLAIGILAAYELVCNVSVLVATHRELRNKYIELEGKMVSVVDITDELLANWQSAVLEIEILEPPVKHAINAAAHNQQAMADGYHEDEQLHIAWPKRLLGHFISFKSPTIKSQLQLGKAKDNMTSKE